MKKYGLEDTARSLARTNPDGSKGVKLRKSYKNHIQDLPGRHNITGPKPIPNGLLDPMLSQYPNVIKPIESGILSKGLEFDKTPVNGIPGFDPADLGMSDQQTLMRRDEGSDLDDELKRKRKKKQLNGDTPKRQHI